MGYSRMFSTQKNAESRLKAHNYFSYLVRGRILLQNSRGFHSSETHNVQYE